MATPLVAGRVLGQLRPADTNAASLYSPPGEAEPFFITVVISNTTGSTASYRVFLDDDGTTYDQTTALYYDVDLATKTAIRIPIGVMNNPDGNLAVRSETNDALTFTALGTTIIA